MDLAGYIAVAFIPQEVVLQQGSELGLGLVFAPTGAQLSGELRVNLLVGGRALFEELGQPIDGAALVTDEQLHLSRLCHLRTLFIVFGCLIRQKNHSISLNKSLAKTGLKLL